MVELISTTIIIMVDHANSIFFYPLGELALSTM